MFESQYFSLEMALVHLVRNTHAGVQAYLVNKLFTYEQEQVEFYLPQLVNLTLERQEWEGLGVYLMDMAAKSYQFAVNLYWHLQAKKDSKLAEEKLEGLLHDCEMTIVNAARPHGPRSVSAPPPIFELTCDPVIPNEELNFHYKQSRYDYFIYQSNFLYFLTGISITLLTKPQSDREPFLKSALQTINHILEETRVKHQAQSQYFRRLFRGVVLPVSFCSDPDSEPMQVVRIPCEHAACYHTKSRVPFKVFLETVSIHEVGEEVGLAIETHSDPLPVTPDLSVITEKRSERHIQELEEKNFEGLSEFATKVVEAENAGIESLPVESNSEAPVPTPVQSESWAQSAQSIRSNSPFGVLKSWKLRGFIVKGEDDLRQELLAMQFIRRVHSLLKAAGIHAFLRPYEIYVTADNAGLIEYIPDTQSLCAIHSQYRSLLAFYEATWACDFPEAQKNFAESLAGYSLICYLLNVKDRHNGNLLVDSQGHIIHIDFGFLLTSSPGGNLNFETAPFKLTREMLELLLEGGNELFEYFKVMLLQGFLELRRHKEELLLLVEMMMSQEPLGCFVREEKVMRELGERFHLGKTEEQCMKLVGELVAEAAENWRTVKYDSYQRYSNGIL